ncbi:MAG: hypothetical protein Q4G33_13855 [bacterium]|nr:hypothetical protein [bacterium]
MEKEQLKDLLSEEIKTEIQELSGLSPGSAEKSKAIDNLATLYKLKIEETKMEMEFDEKEKRRKMDEKNRQKDDALKEQQLKDEKLDRERDELIRKEQTTEQVKDRYIRLGIAAAEIILPLIFYSKWMKKGFKFEETGTFTSTTFRGLFNRFKPTKK